MCLVIRCQVEGKLIVPTVVQMVASDRPVRITLIKASRMGKCYSNCDKSRDVGCVSAYSKLSNGELHPTLWLNHRGFGVRVVRDRKQRSHKE